MNPPRVGPAARPKPAKEVTTPMARPCFLGGADVKMQAHAGAVNIAAPNPCRRRPPMSRGREWKNPVIQEPAMKASKPQISVGRLP